MVSTQSVQALPLYREIRNYFKSQRWRSERRLPLAAPSLRSAASRPRYSLRARFSRPKGENRKVIFYLFAQIFVLSL